MNDGLEHTIRAIRKGRNGTLYIDENLPIYGSSSGILAMLNVEGNIYMGISFFFFNFFIFHL